MRDRGISREGIAMREGEEVSANAEKVAKRDEVKARKAEKFVYTVAFLPHTDSERTKEDPTPSGALKVDRPR